MALCCLPKAAFTSDWYSLFKLTYTSLKEFADFSRRNDKNGN
ncbi:hypothetical protein HM1_1058 [Heliomicrobium modesticaldum Ice1]|uniref:Uncharacterized protein n=1 Tax=Heliobacterium modesticaldum (strain ATCC 51547 / Ice1) TaxID=498761 RepID=B0TI96_HELMI|nr:hypothetical protein HM1_1058 [Heliomicrobium modesticaldum Ice1]